MMTILTRFARRYLLADAAPLSSAERWRSAAAALLGLLIFEGVLFVVPVSPEAHRLLAPLGATSVIVFTLPHSPLAQPWSVIGGLLLPALVGLACGSWLPAGWLAPAVAVAVSIWVMGWLRCIHPPGGAMALVMAVAAGQGVAPGISLAAVGWNTVAILVAAMAVNNLIPGRRYPLCSPPSPATPQRARQSPVGVQEPDLAAALAEIDAYLDISADDLGRVFRRAAHHAFRRHVLLSCGEVMEPAVPNLEFATSLNEAWDLMRRHARQALPVVDRGRRVIGLLGLEDFLRHVEADKGSRVGERVRHLLRPTPGSHADKPEVVGQIMLTPQHGLQLARSDDSIAVAAEVLGQGGQAALPVVDESGRLVGMLGAAGLNAVLFHHEALGHMRGDGTA